MGALSESELSAARSEMERLLMPSTCHILSNAGTADGYGGLTQAWGTASADVPCRLDPVRGRESPGGAALKPYFEFVLTLPYETAITADNRVQISTTTFNVVSVDAEKSWGLCVRAKLERV